MPTATTTLSSKERLDVLFGELAELTGQRNAIDGRIVDIVAEIDGDGLWGSTGCRSISALVAWRTGVSRATRGPSPPSPNDSRTSPGAPTRCGKAGCPWIRSG